MPVRSAAALARLGAWLVSAKVATATSTTISAIGAARARRGEARARIDRAAMDRAATAALRRARANSRASYARRCQRPRPNLRPRRVPRPGAPHERRWRRIGLLDAYAHGHCTAGRVMAMDALDRHTHEVELVAEHRGILDSERPQLLEAHRASRGCSQALEQPSLRLVKGYQYWGYPRSRREVARRCLPSSVRFPQCPVRDSNPPHRIKSPALYQMS
jgi:hypothetical protein